MAEDTAKFQSTYAARIQALLDQEKGLETAPPVPMFSPEELTRRQSANQRQQQLGTLAELSGDRSMGVVGGGLLKQAMEEQKRRITEHGEYDPISGELKMFPEYTKRVTGERLTRERGRLTELEARDYSKWLNDRQKAEERQFLSSLTGAGQGTWHEAGVNAAGEAVVRNSKDPSQVGIIRGGKVVPHAGPVHSRAEFEKESKLLDEFTTGRTQLEDVMQRLGVNKRPGEALTSQQTESQGAYGTGYGGVLTQAAGPLGQQVADIMYTPKQLQIRSEIADQAYQVAHKLAGAALSYGERVRLDPFLPVPNDSVATLSAKLIAAQKKYAEVETKINTKRAAAGSSAAPGPEIPKPIVPAGTQMPGKSSGTTIRYDAQGNRVQ